MDHWLLSHLAQFSDQLTSLAQVAGDHLVQLAQAVDPTDPTGRRVTGETLNTLPGVPVNPAADFSILSIFSRADLIVKTVIVLLILASFWSWTVIFEKIMLIRRINKRSDGFEDAFWSGGNVDELFERVGKRPRDPMSSMFAAAMREWRQSAGNAARAALGLQGGMQQRIERVMQVTMSREMDRTERYMGFLASVGATAPFIGLFGTVWGIMNSFKDIAVQKNTNLATVAPGISEALFATALGLVAAIPAVIAYNKLSHDLTRYANRLEGFAGEFSAIVSREIDQGTK